MKDPDIEDVIVDEIFKDNQVFKFVYGSVGEIQRFWKCEEGLSEKKGIFRRNFHDHIYGDEDLCGSQHSLIISILDDSHRKPCDKIYNEDLLLKFSESLHKIFASTDTLVITNGQKSLLTTPIGKIVNSVKITERFSRKRLNVATVGVLSAADICNPGLASEEELVINEKVLDTNICNLIVVKNGSQLDTTAIQRLLGKDPRVLNGESTPGVIILFGGGLPSLEQFKIAYHKRIPFVVIKQSGGVADLLSAMLERLQASRTTSETKEKILPDRAQLKSIFTSDTDLANASSILSNLLDKMKTQRGLGQVCHNLDLLGVHIVRAAFLECKLDKRVSSRLLSCRIIEKGPEMFCDLLNDYDDEDENLGENLLSQITWNDLLCLYRRLPDEAQIKSSMNSKSITFSGLNVVLRELVQNVHTSIFKMIELPNSLQQNGTKHVSNNAHHIVHRGTWAESDLNLEQPKHLDIFVWYLVSEQLKVAKTFWEKSKQMTMQECFMASGVLDGLERIVYGSKALEKLHATSEKCVSHATNLLNECYQYQDNSVHTNGRPVEFNDPILCTELLLLMKPNDYLSLAYKLQKTEFFRHRSVRDILQSKWVGESTTKKMRLLKLLFPMLFLVTFPFALPIALLVNVSIVTDVVHCFNVPVLKCIFLSIPYTVFVLLLSSELLVDFSSGISAVDYALVLYVVCYTIEEIRQIIPSSRVRCLAYLRSHFRWWNLIDVCCIVCFTTGITLKFVGLLDISRVALAIDVTLFTLRVLALTAVSRNLGPKLVMIGKMFSNDLVPFLLILFVFILGFSIADYSLLHHDSTFSYNLVEKILMNGYWILYGENNLEEFDSSRCDNTTSTCPSDLGTAVVPYIRGFFALISVVLLLNVLIAMFNDTYRKVQNVSYMHWIYNYNELVTEYESKPVLPPPFLVLIIPHTIVYCLGWALKCRCCKKSADTTQSPNIAEFRKGLLLLKTVYLTSGDPYDKYRKQDGFQEKLQQFERKVKERYRKRLLQKKVLRKKNFEEVSKMNRIASLELRVSKQREEIENMKRDMHILLDVYKKKMKTDTF